MPYIIFSGNKKGHERPEQLLELCNYMTGQTGKKLNTPKKLRHALFCFAVATVAPPAVTGITILAVPRYLPFALVGFYDRKDFRFIFDIYAHSWIPHHLDDKLIKSG